VQISFSVNGNDVQVDVNPADRLSDVLRNDLNLSATKVGCNAGDCGACTVLIDGDTACACLTPIAQLANTTITTAEGLSDDGTLSLLQKSFLRHGAAQCGVCTPGMLISAKALLDECTKPTRAQVENALGGVLCRCTGYRKIIDAVEHAHEVTEDKQMPVAGEGVGAAISHLDGVEKVTGKLKYGSDLMPDDVLQVHVIRSPHHFADFKIGDKNTFIEKHEGVLAVFDASDVDGVNCHGVIPPFADQPVFAQKTALYRGEAIAAIVGEPEAIRSIKDDDFPVEWTLRKHALTPAEGIDASMDRLHQNRENNILIRGYVERGNSDDALANAAHTVTVSTSTPFIEHGYIEPEAGYCIRKGDRLEIFGCTQAAQMDRDSLADILGLEKEAIRIMPSACGGGFGSKLDISFQPYVAIAAWHLNRPVAICYSRGESMRSTTKRHPSEIMLTVGCDKDGLLSGFNFDGTFNTGAYASWGPTVANRVPVHASGPYHTPDYRARSTAVHTNTPPSGAFRGFGVPQSAIAQEMAFDQLADTAGIDRLEFRLKNALRNGQPTVTGQVFDQGVGIVDSLEALKPAWQAANEAAAAYNRLADKSESGLRKGVGLGTCWYGCGNTSLPNPSTIRMGITANGTVVLHQGAMDIGQGANTVITQIAADALGIPVHSIRLVDGDTDLTPDCGKTSASRQTFVTGCAAKLAGEKLRSTLLRQANVDKSAEITFDQNQIKISDGTETVTLDTSTKSVNDYGYVFMEEETYNPPVSALDEKGQGIPYAVYGYGAQLMELTVDTRLGTIKLDKITTAHDVGKAINPLLVEGQIEGGVAQGIGLALMEDYMPGRTENLHDYLMPTAGDMPEFDNIIIEVPDAEGPYGAKGLGEHVLIPTAPSILNAIRDATGAIVSNLPATPDKVLAALNSVNGVLAND